MSLVGNLHGRFVHDRRTVVLSDALADLIPQGSRVLDVGCGDGLISARTSSKRPDLRIEGIDVLVRPGAHIPVTRFDGRRLPFEDRSFDAVVFVDVLHHTHDPAALLQEAARVSKGTIVIKDHTRDGVLAGPTLYFMDVVGNAHHGVESPANYWSESQWRHAFTRLNLKIADWRGRLPLYPWWASWIFGRQLHFVARLQTG